MIASIIPTTVAETLNKKVQDTIDPRLFLFCNYEPTISYVISADGWYFTAIQDLYKFALDCNCIIKNYKFFLLSQEDSQFKQLRGILNRINVLRTVTDHNQSDQNGRIEQEQLESYYSWLKACLNKPEPETLEDFSQLNRQLKDLADELLSYVEKFITCLGQRPDKTQVVEEWISRTLHWYCTNTKTEIYKGQLMNTYIANSVARGRDYPELHSIYALNRKIGKWIEAALYFPIDKAMTEIQREINSAQSILSGSNPRFQAIRSKMSEEKVSALEACLRCSIDQNTQKKQTLLEEKEQLKEQVGTKHIDFFFRNLEQQLRNTMIQLEAKGTSYTLLPQDLLQENIELFFGEVPSPEGDF